LPSSVPQTRRKLAQQLSELKTGRAVSNRLVRGLRQQLGYSLQATRKLRDGTAANTRVGMRSSITSRRPSGRISSGVRP